MAYLQFRFIAYQVPTATEHMTTGEVVSAFSPGLECPDTDFAPIVVDSDTPDDARIRLKRLAAVVTRARDRLQPFTMDDRKETLKVFMVPEFYFRPPKDAHPEYLHSTYSYDHAVKLLEQLNKMFVHPRFANWLFVLGSVLWNWHEGGTNYRNSAIYVMGNQVDSLRIVEKDVPSSIDGVPYLYAIDPESEEYVPGVEAYDPYFEELFQRWRHRKNHIFNVGGVVCGLEVCLDHLYVAAPEGRDRDEWDPRDHRVLKRVLNDWAIKFPEEVPNVKLHLLTAGGMSMHEESVAAMPRGYILRNDGFSNAPHVESYQVLKYAKPNGDATVASDLEGKATLRLDKLEGRSKLEGPRLVPIDPDLYQFDQRLIIYQPRFL